VSEPDIPGPSGARRVALLVLPSLAAAGRSRRAAALMLVLLSSLAIASCSDGGSSANRSASAPGLATPLATSLPTPAGTWATLPMGHFEQPLNTFWQLLFRPAGGGPWSNHVQATAVATNGGLVLASPHDSALIAGVLPSNLLTFSPLVYSVSAGRSWSSGLLPEGLAARPDALAASSLTQALALVNGHAGVQVLSAAGSLSTWRTTVTQSALAGSPAGRTCAIGALTAVAYLEGTPLVGASCAHEGVMGLFRERAGGWQLLEGALPPVIERDRVEVLALRATSTGVCALLGVSGQSPVSGEVGRTSATGRTSLIAAWYAAGRWSSSAALPVGRFEQLASFGPTSSNGMFALLTASARPAQLAVANTPGAGWQQLPAPPGGTATVAFGVANRPEALAAEDTVLKVWSLTPHARAWVLRQTMHVALEFGSSE
jgi:hypothetical protein